MQSCFGTRKGGQPELLNTFGTWRSLVARLLWEQDVAGSNPVVPTISCGRSSMVEPQPSKLMTRVRFPSPAPIKSQVRGIRTSGLSFYVTPSCHEYVTTCLINGGAAKARIALHGMYGPGILCIRLNFLTPVCDMVL